MDMVTSKSEVWQVWKVAKQLGLVAVYQDSAAAARGVKFCEELGRQLGPGCSILQQVWFFSELAVPPLREIAAGEAAVSDLILISAHPDGTLPEPARAWLERWLALKGSRSTVLLLLLERSQSTEPSPVQAYLEEVARRGNVECLVQTEEKSE